MVKIEPQVATANTFVLFHDEAYAGTSRADWEAIVNQGDVLKPVDLDDIEPENRECDICREPFGPSSDNPTSPEVPVSLPCGHIFGKDCLENWIAVAGGRGDSGEHENRLDDDSPDEERTGEVGQAAETSVVDLFPDSTFSTTGDPFSCPKCRAEHVEAQDAPTIAARLRFWDHAYEHLGIVRSAEEEGCRDDLWQFVSKPRFAQEGAESANLIRALDKRAQVSAMRFALRRAHWDDTLVQRHLLYAFFHLACCHEADKNDAPEEYSPDAYENCVLPLWCWQFDRFERGLDPRPASGSRGHGFHDEWQQQRLGPWSRELFEERKRDWWDFFFDAMGAVSIAG